MTIEFCKDVDDIVEHVEVDGNGYIEFFYYGYGREEESMEFSIDDLENILAQAKRHRDAYKVYRESSYEDEAYNKAYNELKC